MRRHAAATVALVVALITVSGFAGVASAGAAPSWNMNEPLLIPEGQSETVTLTVYDDIDDESIDEVATITAVGGLEDHVQIDQDEIHFDGSGDPQQVEIVVDPDLDNGDTASGHLVLEHGQRTADGISSVGMQYSFNIAIEVDEPEGSFFNNGSFAAVLALLLTVMLYIARKRTHSPSEA